MRPPFATFAALGLAGLIFLLALLSPTSYTNSDPRLSLLTAQALLEHGSSRLAPYAAALGPEYTVDNYRLSAIGDELFYAYPLGPSLFALPVVTVYRLAGYDMVDPAQEGQVQNLLSALTVALLFLAVSGLIREFDASIRGLGLALMLTLGSSLVSTGATALWNLNLATLFILLALRLLVRAERHGLKPAEAGGLGFSLFAAYLCRPTAALFIALCLFYL